MARYLNLRLPFGLAPTEATIGSYRHDRSVRALHRVYSVGATFGCEKRCFHRYETGGEPSNSRVTSSCQLSPHWHEASGSETQEKMLHSVSLHHSNTPPLQPPASITPASSNFRKTFRDGKNGKTALLHSVQVGFRTSYVTGSDKWNTHRVSFNGYRCTSSLPKPSSQYST